MLLNVAHRELGVLHVGRHAPALAIFFRRRADTDKHNVSLGQELRIDHFEVQVFAAYLLHDLVKTRLEYRQLVGVPRGDARFVLVGHENLHVGVVQRHDGHRRAADVTCAEADDFFTHRHCACWLNKMRGKPICRILTRFYVVALKRHCYLLGISN
jgi:hypothetical protein